MCSFRPPPLALLGPVVAISWAPGEGDYRVATIDDLLKIDSVVAKAEKLEASSVPGLWKLDAD
jgi:hypothetical protein